MLSGLDGNCNHDLDRDHGLSFVGTDAAGDITAVTATVASKAAISFSIMAKADEKLVPDEGNLASVECSLLMKVLWPRGLRSRIYYVQ